ncbi:MAG TPA: transporter substrate-binding domain-containing protein [Pseudomonas oleovorans]|nr:transporter substrate-binding domain-containing protein [Pseudomonas oleovorans]
MRYLALEDTAVFARYVHVLLALLVGFGFQGVAQAEGLRLYTEEYPPINFSRDDGKPTGLATEVVLEIMRRTGDTAPIEVVPWARGYQQAQVRPNTGLFVTMRIPEREKLFHWVGPLTRNTTSFYALRRNGLQLDDFEQARQVGKIAVPRDWYSHQHLLAHGFTNLYPVAGPDQVIRMLKRGRVKLMALDDLSLNALLDGGGLAVGEVEQLLVFLHSDSYIAFSQDTDPRLLARWQQALDAMKADGSFAAIYHKWLPGLPLPP